MILCLLTKVIKYEQIAKSIDCPMIYKNSCILYYTVIFFIISFLTGCVGSVQQPAAQPHHKRHAKQGILAHLFDAQEYKKAQEKRKERLTLKHKLKDETTLAPKDMSFEQLENAKNLTIELGYPQDAIVYLERMIVTTQDQEKLKELRLELADLYFDIGKFEKAGKLYGEYIISYPGSEHKEYAEYKAILCRFYLTLGTDRDQTKTEETLALIQTYLDEPMPSREYRLAIQDIQKQCWQKVRDREEYIFNFYLKQHKFEGAERRLAYIKEKFKGHLDDMPRLVLEMELTLASKQGKNDIIEQKQQELIQQFPQYASFVLAQTTPRKKSHVSTF